jgi:hypothetical protein
MKNAAPLLILAFLLGAGCKHNPIERLADPNPSGARPFPATGGVYTIYDDELKTGGGLGFIPGGENQTIDLLSSGGEIRYSWNGNDVSSTTTTEHLFAGFELLVTPNFVGFESAPGKNLSGAGYTKLKFSIRGSLSANTTVRVEGPDDGLGGITPALVNITTLGSAWQDVTLPIPDPTHFNNVKGFMIVTFQFAQPSGTTTPGGGGTVYVDNIRYEQ